MITYGICSRMTSKTSIPRYSVKLVVRYCRIYEPNFGVEAFILNRTTKGLPSRNPWLISSKKRQNTYGMKPILLKMAQLEQIFYRDPLRQFISLWRELDVRELDALIRLAGVHPHQIIKAINLFQAVHVLLTLSKLFQWKPTLQTPLSTLLKLCHWIPTNQIFQ